MKKILLTIVSSICIGLSAHAQSTVQDTTAYTKNSGCLQKNSTAQAADGKIINNSTVADTISWTLSNLNLLSGWELDAICDINTCKTASQLNANPGPWKFVIQPGQTANLTVDLIGSSSALDGTNWVTVTTNRGDMVYKFSTCPLSTKDVDGRNVVDIFPNPANNYINLSLNDKNITAVHVTNVVGRKIAKFDVDANNSPFRIAIDNITNGIYFLQFTDNKGKILAVRKVTKQ